MGGTVVDLKGLIHRELGEGLTETELATAARTSVVLDSLHVSPTLSANLTKHLSLKGVSLLNVMHLSPLTTLTLCAVLSACVANTPFPPEVMEKVSPTFHFEAWRDASPTNESGKSDAGIKVQLGGRIVQATENGKGIVIVAAQLPIVNYPVYGPTETEEVTRSGDYEFAFLYTGEIEPLDLMRGNRFIVVGTTTSRRPVLVNGIPKTEPFLIADCIHVWQTAGDEIADFKGDMGGGLSPLPETTYCVAKK
jgi:starvation-inducible outer membrane lipoprotein